ncbi:sodium channel protein type 4 subunit alpha B-like [Lates japonicus]
MSFWDFWRGQEERGALLRRTNQLRLHPSQLKRLLSDGAVRAELRDTRMVSLLPPVGTEAFRHLTPASLEEIQRPREAEEKEQQERKQVEEKDRLKQAAHLEAGKPLPFIYGDPPPELLNTPLEELDPFYQSQKMFVVLSKGKVIHRFNAEPACYLLSPFNRLRTFAIRILVHSWFRLFVLLTILTNCVLMMLRDHPAWSDTAEYVFTAIYTFEIIIKTVSRGFCIGRFTFLRDPWNWLDVIVVGSIFLTEFIYLGKVTPVLWIVPRTLKMIAVCPGVKKTVGAVVQSVKRLAGVIVLTVLGLSVLAMVGLQLFMGNLRQKCVIMPPLGNLTEIYLIGYHDNETGSSDINSAENYYYLPGQLDALVCGNSSDSGRCPEGYICLRAGQNPNYGYTSYDSFGWSLLETFRLMTLNFWENLIQLTYRAVGKISTIAFVLLVFPTCFCLLSLIMAVVTMASVEQDRADVTEAKQREEEFIQILEVMRRREEEGEGEAACRVELLEKQDSAPQKKNSAVVIKNQEDHAIGDLRMSCPPCCLTCLRWNCCGCWRWLKQRLYTLVTHPFFDFGVVVCLILNTIFLAMEHYPMTVDFEELLSIMSLVFTAIFTAEMLLRIMAMDPYGYFQVSWNVFDSVIVIISLLELAFADIEGLPVLRCFHLMRVLRLARWWPTFHMLMKIIWASVGALRNLTLVLLIMVFTFTVVGMQLFHKDYKDCVCRIAEDCELPRWHMNDLFHTFILIFRVLCGDWIETLWDCMEVSGRSVCLIFFMMVLLIGNLLVLNLFLALLLSSSTGDNLTSPKERREGNLQITLNRIKGGAAWIRTWILEHIWTLRGKQYHHKPDHKVDSKKDNTKEYLGLTSATSDQPVSDIKAPKGNRGNTGFQRVPIAEAEIEFKTPEDEEKKQLDGDNQRENSPEDCCCDGCYHCCPFLDVNTSQGTGRVWSNIRRACFSIVQHRYFEVFIIVIILLSSAVLVLEDIHLQQRQVLQMVLDKADQVFTYLFLLEMLLKWIAFGFKKYFTSFWCWLDFLILAMSLMSSTLGMMGYSELGAGVSLRTVRALRPLRILSRFQGLRVVLRTLTLTLPSMFDALLVALVVWLIFSIMGVNLFAGKFCYCFNETSEAFFTPDLVNNNTECFNLIMANFTEIRWKNVKVHYDNVAMGYLSLLQVATFSGWFDIMYAAVDSREVESQPEYEANLYMYLYFICFIIIGRFFTFNLFIRAFINALDQLRHKTGKHVFMTEEQQKLSRALKRPFSEKPQKPVPRPQNKCQALLFDLVTNPYFEVFMVVVICLNAVALMVETDVLTEEKEAILYWIHFIFIIIFFIECLLKIIALRQHYFSDCLNVIDLVIVSQSIVGMFLADLLTKYFFSLNYVLPLLRLARISRIIHLVPGTQRIRTLLLAFRMSLPALFNICFLLFILMFTFSIFGMISFGHIKNGAMIDDMTNFETFVNSMICLLIMTMRAGWDGLLLPILNTPPDCDPYIENPGSTVRGDCGSPMVGIIFFISYITLSILLVVQLFITVVLETFNMDDAEHLSDDDLQMFYKTWKMFDPDASQVIEYSQLSDFCDALQEPLRTPKPNTIKLIHMDLPLLPGDKIHCADILLALTAQVFGDSGEMDSLKDRLERKFTTDNSSKVPYEPISSTLRRKQEEVAATVIQRAYKKLLLQHRDAEERGAEPAGEASGV